MSFDIDYKGKSRTEKKDLGRIGVVVPAYNEGHCGGKSLKYVVEGLHKLTNSHNFRLKNTVIVNDASTDNTADVLDNLVETYHIETINNIINLGKEGAVKNGLGYLVDTNLNRDLEGIVTLDADGQHDPAYIPFLTFYLNEGYKMVIGTRDRREMPLDRRGANSGVNLIYFLIGGLKSRDIQSGFRAYDFKSASLLANELDDDGKFLMEHDDIRILIKNAFEEDFKFRIAERYISCRYRHLRKSHIKLKNVLRLLNKTVETACEIRRYR